MSTKIRSVQLQQGTNKLHQPYNRQIQFKPGMEELVNIVAGLQKDVKRINKAITLQGAMDYIKNKPNWSAHEEDITGPNGKPDGIKEVFIADSKGNVKAINGYTLGKSDYPMRKLYRTAFPTREDRKEVPYGRFKSDFKLINGHPTLENGYSYQGNINGLPNINENNAGQFVNIQRPPIKARDYFKQNIFSIVYATNTSAESNPRGIPKFLPMVKAQLYNKALSHSYNEIIRDRILENVFGLVASQTKPSTIARITKSDDFQAAALDMIVRAENPPADNPDEGPDHQETINDWQVRIAEIISDYIDILASDPNNLMTETETIENDF